MSVEISQEMIGLEQASAALDTLMAADAAGAKAAQEPPKGGTPNDQSASDGQRAAQPGSETTQSSDSISKTDTPAVTDQSKDQSKAGEPSKGGTPNKDQQQQTTKEPSKFTREQGRQKSAWEQINATKEELKAERARLEEERKAIVAQREEASREKFKPEDYEQAAAKFEEQGKFDLAEAARERAKKLRENPPKEPPKGGTPNEDQAKQFEQQKKEWLSKASIDYPSVAKEGTPENAALKEFIKAEPMVLQSPRALYYGARMVQAETAAARVPGMEKELGELRAKVKELEALTAPNPPAVPGRGGAGEQPFNQKSEKEQFADLERQAQEMGTLR